MKKIHRVVKHNNGYLENKFYKWTDESGQKRSEDLNEFLISQSSINTHSVKISLL